MKRITKLASVVALTVVLAASLMACGGIAEYFDIDPTLVRLAWVILSCIGAGTGIIAYIIASIIIPK